MTDEQKLFLAAYPLWPIALLSKFDSLLSLELAKFNSDISPDIIKQYLTLSLGFEIPVLSLVDNAIYENTVTVLNPENNRYITATYFNDQLIVVQDDSTQTAINAGTIFASSWNYYTVKGKLLYDKRIYSNLTCKPFVRYVNSGKVKVGVFEYANALAPNFFLQVVPNVYPYNGAITAQAMIENGININVDKKLLDEFCSFLRAYDKYSNQLSAYTNLQNEKNAQSLSDYKNQLSDKLNQRKAELTDLKSQIAFAANNETNSAKRDMQNLLLSAQNLIISLQGTINT